MEKTEIAASFADIGVAVGVCRWTNEYKEILGYYRAGR